MIATVLSIMLLAQQQPPNTRLWTVEQAVAYCEQQRKKSGRAACQLPADVVVKQKKG